MGKINVEGLGVVEIAGNEPTAAEALSIKEKKNEILAENLNNQEAERQGTEYSDSFNFKRLLLEVGLSIGGALATGGAALPVIAARGAMLSRPFLTQLAKSAGGSAIGGGTGAGLAQTFDPKEDVVREIARGAIEGAVGEVVGAPVAIKGAAYMKKFLGDFTPRAKLLDNAQVSENAIIKKAQDMQLEQAALDNDKKLYNKLLSEFGDQVDKKGNIIRNGRKDIPTFEQMKSVEGLEGYKKSDIEFAREAQFGLTPGIKTSNRSLEILENIAQKSLFGGGGITKRYEAVKEVGDKLAKDYVNQMQQLGGEGTVGEVFFNSLADAKDMWRSTVSGLFKAVDQQLIQQNMFDTGFVPIREIIKGAKRGTKFSYDGMIKGLDEDLLSMESFLTRFGDVGEQKGVIKFIQGDLATYMNRARVTGGNLTLTDTDDLRKIIGKKLADAKKNGDGLATNFYTGLYKNLNEELTKLADESLKNTGRAGSLPTAAANKLKEAISTSQQGHTIFNTRQIDSILKAGSEKTLATTDNIFKTIVQSNGTKTAERVMNRVDELTKMKGIDGKPLLSAQQADNLRSKLKGNFIWEKLYSPSLKSGEAQYGGEILDADLFKNKLDDWKDMAQYILTPKEYKSLQDMATTLQFSQGKLSRLDEPPGGIFIQLKQAGEATKLLQFGAVGYTGLQDGSVLNPTSATIMLGPWGVAKALLSPKIQKLMFTAAGDATATDTPEKAAMLFRRITAQMAAGGIYDNDQKAIADQYSREFERGQTILQPQKPITKNTVDNLPKLPLKNVGTGNLPNTNVTLGPQSRQALASGNLDAAIAAQGMYTGGIVNAKKKF
jgi:hypothetical protein